MVHPSRVGERSAGTNEIERDETSQPYSEPNYELLVHAPFAQHGFWVTQYKDGDLSAVGVYPNQGPGGEGLNQYVNGQSITDRDVVVWYTAAFTHDPSLEKFPIHDARDLGLQDPPGRVLRRDPGAPTCRQALTPTPQRAVQTRHPSRRGERELALEVRPRRGGRNAFGVDGRTGRGSQQFPSVDAARSFVQDPGLRGAMERGGVQGEPQVHMRDEVEPVEY